MALVASTGTVVAGRANRKVSKAYTAPFTERFDQDDGATDLCRGSVSGVGCVRFVSRGNESFVRLRAIDGSGLPVAARVEVDADGAGPWAPFPFHFCGKMTERKRVGPAPVTITVFLQQPAYVNFLYGPPFVSPGISCGGVPTSGVVKATFS